MSQGLLYSLQYCTVETMYTVRYKSTDTVCTNIVDSAQIFHRSELFSVWNIPVLDWEQGSQEVRKKKQQIHTKIVARPSKNTDVLYCIQYLNFLQNNILYNAAHGRSRILGIYLQNLILRKGFFLCKMSTTKF